MRRTPKYDSRVEDTPKSRSPDDQSTVTVDEPATPALDPSPRLCPNCGGAAPDRFCPRCGQKQGERLVSTRRLVGDMLEDSFSLEARLPRTLGALLVRPGFLTREFVNGRIARYLHPLRLYVVASLAFFLVLSFVAEFDDLWRVVGPRIEAAPDSSYQLLNTQVELEQVPAPFKPAARAWLRQEQEVNALGRREGVRVLYEATLSAVPPVVFLMVPFFALVLKAMYRRRLFVEHAVFMLHFHSLGFLLAACGLLLRTQWLAIALGLWIAAWLFLAMRGVYAKRESGAEHALVTALKYAGLVLTYAVAFAITVVGVMIAAIMSI